MNYREQVQRVLTVHHAGMELGLSKAREQQPFVERIAGILSRNRIPFTWGLTHQFDAVFRLPETVINDAALLETLFAGCTTARGLHGWTVSETHREYLQVQLKTEADDGF